MVLIFAALIAGCGNAQGSETPEGNLSTAAAGPAATTASAIGTAADQTDAKPVPKPQGLMELKFNAGAGIDSGITESAGSLYFGADDTLLAVDEVTGQERWRVPVAAKVEARPSVEGGTVYFAGNEFSSGEKNGFHVYAVDAATGQEKWRFAAASDVLTLEASGGVVYAAGTQALYALDAASGQQKWTRSHGAMLISAADPATLFVADSDSTGPNQTTAFIYALNKSDGQARWEIHSDGAPSGLLADGGSLYLATFGEREGNSRTELPPALFALDAASGEQRWVFTPEGSGSQSPARFQKMSISHVEGGRLFIFNEDMDLSSSLIPKIDRSLVEIDKASGTQRGGYHTASGYQVQDLSDYAPAYLDGVFYITTADLGEAANDSNARITYYISAVAAASGQELWTVPARSETRMLLSYGGYFNGLFYFAARDSGEIYAIH